VATPLWMSVNASVSDLHDEGLSERVLEMMSGAGVHPGTLIFEITESVLLDDSEATRGLLTRFKDLGVKTALDDFGTAFSSLSYLRRFPFDHLKLDISFIAEVTTSTRTLLLVEEICHLAKAMHMQCIAEGVELREQVDLLRSVGCEYGQGFLFSKPLPAEECELILEGQRDRAV